MAKSKETGRGDDRIAHESRRAPLSSEVDRGSREAADAERMDEGMELTQDQREQMLRDDALQNYLPNPPPRTGIHWFWANTKAESGSTVAWYKRLGYKLVRYDELSGWADANMRSESGEYADCITVREMVLMKVNEVDYQRYMQIVHHEKPNAEANRVAEMVNQMKSNVGEANIRGVAGPGETDGFTLLERSTRVRKPATFE